MNNIDFNRLLELKSLIDNNQASSEQKKEYVELLYRNGNISKSQYESYKKNHNTDEIINAALTIGGVILATWLLSKILD